MANAEYEKFLKLLDEAKDRQDVVDIAYQIGNAYGRGDLLEDDYELLVAIISHFLSLMKP